MKWNLTIPAKTRWEMLKKEGVMTDWDRSLDRDIEKYMDGSGMYEHLCDSCGESFESEEECAGEVCPDCEDAPAEDILRLMTWGVEGWGLTATFTDYDLASKRAEYYRDKLGIAAKVVDHEDKKLYEAIP